jgi:hypothetical protein
MRTTSISVLVLCTLGVTTLLAQNPMRPGRWDVTVQMQMPNMPIQMPETKSSQCVTPEQLKDPSSAVPSGSPNPRDKDACKVTDHMVSDNVVRWKVTCAPPQAMTGTGEMTFKGDSYTGTIKMTMPQGEMTMKLAGKRVGDCTQ